ncbi:NAD(P)H-dependent oxidoreductase [uncultured Alteromonas sp.]|jgi:putative NADPH-quinone reductase|uniref:NAD(P)H-dependent oxidoreductase n=1 Tax=uncultured Alteromonas sp. TaxID=179113 RepID=UPI0025FA4F34|nr:NAD(P)H-dependent oxidoreductase [uncultured Alteromonas sp.]
MSTQPSSSRILLLFAHPSQARSEVNSVLFNSAKQLDAVTAVDLYAQYPDFNINIEREQQRLLSHDIIIFQFPVYWYSTPALLKEWQDLVLEYGFAYGKGGDALKGKLFFCAVSAGGREEAYQTDGFNHFTLRQLLQPLEQMASITQLTYLAPFALFGSRTAKEEHRITRHSALWTALLEALAKGELDIAKARQLENMTSYFNEQELNQ